MARLFFPQKRFPRAKSQKALHSSMFLHQTQALEKPESVLSAEAEAYLAPTLETEKKLYRFKASSHKFVFAEISYGFLDFFL